MVDLLLHVFPPGIRKELRVPRRLMLSPRLLHQPRAQPHRTRPIIPNGFNASGLHGLEANYHGDVDDTASHERAGELQACGTCCACVVRVYVIWWSVFTKRNAKITGIALAQRLLTVNWDVRHSELVEDALA